MEYISRADWFHARVAINSLELEIARKRTDFLQAKKSPQVLRFFVHNLADFFEDTRLSLAEQRVFGERTLKERKRAIGVLLSDFEAEVYGLRLNSIWVTRLRLFLTVVTHLLAVLGLVVLYLCAQSKKW